jgi:5S rRNA maturation endonuclease (ribonuclease M5)
MYRSKFRAYFGSIIKDSTAESINICCEWHNDSTPSLNLNCKTGKYHCFSCGKDGHIDDLLKGIKTIDDSVVEDYHAELINDKTRCEYLQKIRGWDTKTICNLKIGWDGQRYTLPVRDDKDRIINIRKYLPDSGKSAKMLPYDKEHAAPAFFPFPPKENEIILMEGEPDTILARQMGFAAYCQTGGASTWNKSFTAAVTDKRVSIIYDADHAGIKGAKKIVDQIKFCCKEVRNIKLPIGTKGKDFSDWVLKCGGTTVGLKTIIDDTPPYITSKLAPPDQDPIVAKFEEITDVSWVNKYIRTQVVINGKSEETYLAPKKIIVDCSPNPNKCAGCPNINGNKVYDVPWMEGHMLRYTNVSDTTRDALLREHFGMPKGCQKSKISIEEMQQVECLVMQPCDDMEDLDEHAADSRDKRGFFLGSGVCSNTAYTIKCFVVSDPKTQASVFLLSEIAPVDDIESVSDTSACEIFREKD